MSSSPIIEIENLRAGYGDAVVLDGISLSLEAGKSLALLGRNGVGKTTLIASLLGHTRCFGGMIRFDGEVLDYRVLHASAGLGIGWVPQERAIFRSLTVRENMTATARPGAWTLERVYDLFPRLQERERNLGNQLSGGEQQMLAIGRALMLNPRLLLLDEPFEGLAPVIVEELSRVIQRLREEDRMTLILVEQHVDDALELSDEAIVLDRGKVRHHGPAKELLQNRKLLESLVSLRAIAAETV